MTVAAYIQTAKKRGYKRLWLTCDDFDTLLAEFYLSEEAQWKNSALSPFVFDEYSEKDVIEERENPYQPDTLMILVKYDPELQGRACERCLNMAKKFCEKEEDA